MFEVVLTMQSFRFTYLIEQGIQGQVDGTARSIFSRSLPSGRVILALT